MNAASKISLFLVALLIISCDDTGSKNVTAVVSKDSVEVKQDTNEIAHLPVILKEMVLNAKTITGRSSFFTSKVMDTDEAIGFSLKVIDSSAPGSHTAYKYHLVDTLFANSRVTILLIGREYTEENILWIASYDSNSKLIDRLMVYYDNSEGSVQTESVVKANEVVVTSTNDYAETQKDAKRTEFYHFDENNRLAKEQ